MLILKIYLPDEGLKSKTPRLLAELLGPPEPFKFKPKSYANKAGCVKNFLIKLSISF
jgi:hypothetical protein